MRGLLAASTVAFGTFVSASAVAQGADAEPQGADAEPYEPGPADAATSAPEPPPAPSDAAPLAEQLPEVSLEPEPPPRRPLAPSSAGEELPWERHIEIGADFAYSTYAEGTNVAGQETGIRYESALGFGVHARVPLLPFFRFAAYFVDSHHHVAIPRGALGLDGETDLPNIATFSFGAKLMPTYPWTDWIRSWVAAGIGWGRFEFDRMQVQEEGKPSYEVRDRSTPFVEIPIGVGTTVEVWPRWVALTVELSLAPVLNEDGDALEDAQTIDADGRKQNVRGFPAPTSHFVQTIGLSLLL